MNVIRKIVNSIQFKVTFLFVVSLLPRIINLGGHDIFVDEITWMSRCKDVYAAIRTLSWHPDNIYWWLTPNIAEAIGLPVTFLGGIAMTYLSPGYSVHSLNLVRDFVATRIPVALIGTFFIPVFYLLLRKFVNDKVAFVTSLLFAVDPIAIGLSRWLQHDMTLVACTTISFILYLLGKNKWSIVGSAFFAAMAILTKPQGFLIPATLVVLTMILALRKEEFYLKKLLIWLVLSAGFTVIFFPYLWGNPIGNMLTYMRLQVANVDLGNLTYFNGQITSNPPWYYFFVIFPFRIPESILIGFVAGMVLLVVNIKKGLFQNKLFTTGLIYSILFVFLICTSNKKLGIRYLFGIWPYIYLLAGYGLIYVEKFISKPFKKIYWLFIFLFPIWGVLKFYPSYYLFHNHFISPHNYQSLESVGYCDSVKPAIEYLGPKLYHGIKIMLPGCDAAINYYTGFTINRVNTVNEKPDYIIEETHNLQKSLDIFDQINKAGYKEIKTIDFRGLILAKIYQKY
jgi:hypothetical protein